MRALQIDGWHSEPVLRDVPMPKAGPGQVVVRIAGAGVCHSDLHILHELDESLLPWSFPFTLGHENSGWVHEIGAGVSGLAVGQPVVIQGAWGCGVCDFCLTGNDPLCLDVPAAPGGGGGGGLGVDGGMADYMLVPAARYVLPIPDSLDPVGAAPLADAALTPYHAIRRSLHKLPPGSIVAVLGIGGLGHFAVQMLRALTASTIVAVDPRADARTHALELGADIAVATESTPAETVAAILEATGGRKAEVVLDLVGLDSTIATAVGSVRALGDVTIVGVGGGTYPAGYFTMPYEMSLQQVYWGSRSELREVLRLAERGIITPTYTAFPLEEGPEVLRRLAAGEFKGRAVLTPGT